MSLSIKGYLLCLLVVVAMSCKNEQKSSEVKQDTLFQQDSPEYICMKWSQLLDSNKIDDAKSIATDSAKSWLDTYAKMLTSTKSDTVFTKTVFDTIYCKPIGDSCTCYYLIKIEGDLLKDSFQLVRVKGNWKMGVPPVVEEDIFLDQDEDSSKPSHQ